MFQVEPGDKGTLQFLSYSPDRQKEERTKKKTNWSIEDMCS